MRLNGPVLVVMAVISTLAAQGQVLTEHAAVIAGGAAGTAAGKPVSNALTKIFSGVDKAGKSDAGKATPTKVPESKPEVTTSGPVGEMPGANGGAAGERKTAPRTKTVARRRAGLPAPAPVPVPVVAAALVSAPAPIPVVREVAPEKVLGIKVGTTKQDMRAEIGAPAWVIEIPDEGRLIELCSYRSQGRAVAVIQLDNGRVASVTAK